MIFMGASIIVFNKYIYKSNTIKALILENFIAKFLITSGLFVVLNRLTL